MSFSSQSNTREHTFLSKKTRKSFQSNDLIDSPQLSNEALKHIDKISQCDTLPPYKHNINNSEVSQFLSTLSIREKYESLLQRKELTLPPKYQLLLKKQTVLDSLLASESKDNNITHIRNEMSKRHHLGLSAEDFERILYVVPFYYIYQARKMLNGDIELICVDIPHDYEKRQKMKYTDKTNFVLLQTQFVPFKGQIGSEALDQRKGLFKKVLMHMTRVEHDEFIKSNNLGYFDPVKNKTWHHLFDDSTVKDVACFKLVENNIKDIKKKGIR